MMYFHSMLSLIALAFGVALLILVKNQTKIKNIFPAIIAWIVIVLSALSIIFSFYSGYKKWNTEGGMGKMMNKRTMMNKGMFLGNDPYVNQDRYMEQDTNVDQYRPMDQNRSTRPMRHMNQDRNMNQYRSADQYDENNYYINQ